jgi:hypothetical protein
MVASAGERSAEGGLWFSWSPLELRVVPAGGGVLPLDGGIWRRVPGWLLVPAAPLVGGLLLVAFPLAGAAMVALELARRAVLGGRALALDLTGTLAPPPAAGEAHLTGAPGAGPPAGSPALDGQGELGALEAEIRARQAGGAGEPKPPA